MVERENFFTEAFMEEERVTVDLVAAAFIRSARGRILFVLRRGKWTLPTGHLHPQDKGDLRKALRREMREELGVAIFVGDSLGKMFREKNRNGRSKWIEVFYCAVGEAVAKKIRFHEKDESGELWLTAEQARHRDDIDELGRVGLELFLQKLSQIKRRDYDAKGGRGGIGSNGKICHRLWVASI